MLDDAALLAQCDVDTYRASGPGGQKRNKTSSAVRLRHRPTGLATVGTESRSQHENKARALRRLRQAIALNVRCAVKVAGYRPGELLQSCLTRHDRLQVGAKDYRYWAVAAELLDLMDTLEGKVRNVAALLEIKTANLAAVLQSNPKLRVAANAIRQKHGHKPLR